MKKIIYLADDEDEQDAIRSLFERGGIEVFPAQTEEEVLEVVTRELTIRLIVIGVREEYTSVLVNHPPCDQIPKVPLVIDENEPHLRAIYSPVFDCVNMDKQLWQEELKMLVDKL